MKRTRIYPRGTVELNRGIGEKMRQPVSAKPLNLLMHKSAMQSGKCCRKTVRNR